MSPPHLDVVAVGRKVHLHHKAGDVPAAVDSVQLRAERQVVEVNGALIGAHSQVARIRTEPAKEEMKSQFSSGLFNSTPSTVGVYFSLGGSLNISQ